MPENGHRVRADEIFTAEVADRQRAFAFDFVADRQRVSSRDLR